MFIFSNMYFIKVKGVVAQTAVTGVDLDLLDLSAVLVFEFLHLHGNSVDAGDGFRGHVLGQFFFCGVVVVVGINGDLILVEISESRHRTVVITVGMGNEPRINMRGTVSGDLL